MTPRTPTRQEIYDLVWSKTMTQPSTEFELSDVGLKRSVKLLKFLRLGYQWKCLEGHKWNASADSVVNSDAWCIICKGLKLEHPLEDLKELAKQKRGKCLSTEYVNSQTKMLFQCEDKSHGPWWATANHIKNDHWCYKCSRNYIANPIQELQEVSRKKGWKLVSHEYVNAHTKLLFACLKKKHQILCAPTSMKSHPLKCPACEGRPRSRLLIENQI